MRTLMIFACLLTFALNSFATLADASAPAANQICGADVIQVEIDHDDTHHDHCHNDVEHKDCDGCCCIHAHSVALLVSSDLSAPFSAQKGDMKTEADPYHSFDPASLYRPPRL